ncbi:hypothetical protein NLJ89_g6417 [Agrocybe chaxingu]|uniref:Uncharacterized protein n=1 Tax=Agrocybe chaxingu TaxID=84603 RepID=A0A9W8K0U1_9AGAR|nr:hypothetical protein NLJ89_g6417 [Agrocybe chaxingu]
MLNFHNTVVLKDTDRTDTNTMLSMPPGPSTYSATVVDVPFARHITLANPRTHRLIRLLLWTSIPLCAVILTDAIFMLYITSTRSFYLAPAAFGLTMLHHLIVLVISYFERRGRAPLEDGIPVTVSLGAIFGAWLSTLAWAAVAGVRCWLVVDDFNYPWVAMLDLVLGCIELGLAALETFLMGSIAYICTLERRKLVRDRERDNQARW